MKNRTGHAAAIAAIGIAAGAAQAGPVTMEFGEVARAEIVTISVQDEFEGRVYAGSIIQQVNDAERYTFCIEPEQAAQTGVSNFERVGLGNAFTARADGGAKARVVAELADIAGPSIWTSTASKIAAAAFQVAAWEVISDYDSTLGASSFDFAGGSFRSWGNSSVITAASDLLSSLTFSRADATGYDAYLHGDHQDFMSLSVPTPGAIAVAFAGMPLLAARRRRS